MLTIALEPEAAALYVKDLPVEKRICENKSVDFETFAPGSKYIVVDVGGMVCVNHFFYLRVTYHRNNLKCFSLL